jgi:Tfp pilus assembly protein PilO
MLLIAAAALIGAVLLADKLNTERAAMHETLEVNYATYAKKKSFIQRTLKAGSEIKAALTDLEQSEAKIIPQSDPSLGFAALQARVQDLAQDAGMRIYAIRQLQSVTARGYISLPIFVEMRGDIATFSAFLRQIDAGEDFISIDNLNVTTSQEGTLRVRLQLSGLMKP